MPYANDYFSAPLMNRLDADGKYLPIGDTARADLLRFIPSGSYTWASIVNDTTMETVIIRNEYGTLLLERGREGTTAVAHPPGSCVRTVSPTILAAIKDIHCNYQCCE